MVNKVLGLEIFNSKNLDIFKLTFRIEISFQK